MVAMAWAVACSAEPAPSDPDTGPRIDAGIDAGTRCRTDAECSDGTFCNGAERCMGDGGGDSRGCAPAAAASPCSAGQVCDETMDRCTTTCPDADGDGHTSMGCGGDDCDDTDGHRFPGNLEVCALDATTGMRVDATHDEDCNAMTFANATSGDGDHDGDGYVDTACLNRDVNGNTFRGNDCADLAPVVPPLPFTMAVAPENVHPAEGESCNGVDDDCTGGPDDGLTVLTYYPDCDGDLFGDASATGVPGCDPIVLAPCMGHAPVLDATDCDDAAATRHPGLTDVCDGVDNDCNAVVDDATSADASCTTMFPTPAHGTVRCGMAGTCVVGCAMGYGNCDGGLGNGCEANLQTDPLHCGSCPRACGAASACTSGGCEGAITIDAGPAHTCVLYASGRAACWGRNNEGQLGDGTRTDRSTPVAVVAPVGGVVQSFTYIEAGGLRTENGTTLNDRSATCAGTSTSIYCWGRGNEGQLGNAGTASSSAPVLVSAIPVTTPFDAGPPTLLAVSVGGTHALAYQSVRRGFGPPRFMHHAWGNNASGQLGSAPPPMTSSVPISTDSAWTLGIAAGPSHTCWMPDIGGTPQCFGSNTYGEAPASVTVPMSMGYGQDLTAGGIAGSGTSASGWAQTSSAFTCVALPVTGGGGGFAYCWGANGQGQLGNGGTAGALVAGLTDLASSGFTGTPHVIAAGGRHACAVRATGRVVCWGHNLYGQLGNGTTTDSNRPVNVMGVTTAVSVATGAEHSCAVLADGTARCWGRNDHGQLGNGTTTDSATPVVVMGL